MSCRNVHVLMKHRLNLPWLIVLAVVLCSRVAQATPFVPPTLSPGDSYQLVFVTDGVHDAASGFISTYNTFVQNEAALNPALTGTNVGVVYKAIASTLGIDANLNAPVTAPVYNFNGDKIADNFADMWDSTIDNPIVYTQYAGTVFPPDIWTGTQLNGLKFAGAELGAANPRTGRLDLADGKWINETISNSSFTSRFYGLSNVLMVPVPEPSAIVLAMIGLASVALAAWRNRNRAWEPQSWEPQ